MFKIFVRRFGCNTKRNNVTSKLTSNQQQQSVGVNASMKTVAVESYGCAMNINDSEIVLSILEKTGTFKKHSSVDNSDVVLINTCAIREGAEAKIWQRLNYFQSIKRKNKAAALKQAKTSTNYPMIGVLGCMAERLKEKLLDHGAVDFVCGPDAYRDIPRIVSAVTNTGQKEANVRLSIEGSYYQRYRKNIY